MDIALGEQSLRLLGEGVANLVGKGSAAGNGDFERGQFGLTDIVGPGQGVQQGGHGGQDIGLGSRKDAEQRLQFEARQHDDGRAIAERHVHADGHGEDVEEGQDRDHLGGRVEEAASPLVDLAHIGRDIGMGEQGTLGNAGGTAGILLDGNVLGGIHGDRGGGVLAGQEGLEGGEGTRMGRLAGLRQVLALDHREEDFLDQRQISFLTWPAASRASPFSKIC
jgi:hypothetical protein